MTVGLEIAIGAALLNAGASFATASAIITAAPALIAGAAAITTSAVLAERARAAYAQARSSVNESAGLKQAVPNPSPEHWLALGTAIRAGTPFFFRGGKSLRPHLTMGVLLAAHECDGLVALWINNTRILIDPATRYATSVPFFDGVTPFIEASFRAGTLGQARDPIITAYHAEKPATFRQRGHCTGVVRAHYGTGSGRTEQDEKHKELYGDGAFEPLWEFRGAKIYDPRALNQAEADPSTWAWSDNASLCTAHAIRWYRPDARFDWGRMAAAADIDDSLVITKSLEAIRRHTIDGTIRSGEEAAQVIPALLSANGGQLLRSGGKMYILPAQVKRPVGTLHMGNLRGDIVYSPDRRLGETINETRPEFFSVEGGFNIIPGPVIRDQAEVDADGVERAATARLPYTRDHRRAQRLATRLHRQGREPATFTCGVDISGLEWEAGQVIALDLAALNPDLTGDWEIVTKRWDTRGHFPLALRRYSASAEAFDPATDEQDFSEEAA